MIETLRVIIQLSMMGSLIYDSIMSSCVTMIENMKEVASNFWNLYHFYTIAIFGQINFAAVVEGFQNGYTYNYLAQRGGGSKSSIALAPRLYCKS